MEIRRGNLDKPMVAVVKYFGIPYRVERKEYRFSCLSENLGHWLEAWVCAGSGKCVRERTYAPLE